MKFEGSDSKIETEVSAGQSRPRRDEESGDEKGKSGPANGQTSTETGQPSDSLFGSVDTVSTQIRGSEGQTKTWGAEEGGIPAGSPVTDRQFPHFEPGDIVGQRFEIESQVGQGGMGTVFKAIDRERQGGRAPVALKFPRLDVKYRDQLLKELEEALSIHHRNVCRVYNVERHDDEIFMVMEFVPQCLRSMIEGKLTLPLVKALRIAKGICRGLDAVHDAKKLHQDLKPDNIMIAEGLEAKISDLGLVSSRFQGMGAPFYLAPEVLRDGHASRRSDIYSLGLILFEMVCDKRSVSKDGRPDRDLICRDLLNPRIDSEFARLVRACLESDPERRPGTALDVLSALESIERGLVEGRHLPYNLRPDGTPLRTKIVASVGWSPAKGERKTASYVENLATRLLNAGADVIRIDLAACDSTDQVKQIVQDVRQSIQVREGLQDQARLHAIWVDLPGPLLQIVLRPEARSALPGVGDKFYLALGSNCAIGADGELCSGDELLLDAVARIDDGTVSLDKGSNALRNLSSILKSGGSLEPALNFEGPGEEAEAIMASVAGLRMAGRSARQDLQFELEAGADSGEAFLASEETGWVLVLKRMHTEAEWLECEVIRRPDYTTTQPVPMTFRGLDCSLPTCTERDLDFARAALDLDLGSEPEKRLVAYLGLRHVQEPDELLRLRKAVEDHIAASTPSPADRDQVRLAVPSILGAIESRRGFRNRNYLLDVADGVIVGDGDLAVPRDTSSTPERRSKIVKLANKRGKPTFGLCQMGPGPEAGRDAISDAFSMVQEGVDAVVLPVKITSGQYPEKILDRTISITSSGEKYFEFAGLANPEIRSELRRSRLLDFLKDDYERIAINERRLDVACLACSLPIRELGRQDSGAGPEPGAPAPPIDRLLATLEWRIDLYDEKFEKAAKQEITNRITESACLLAETGTARAIVTASTSGRTSRMVARMRARVVTIGVTHDAMNARKLVLSHGVIPVWSSKAGKDDGMEELFTYSVERIEKNRYLTELLRGQVIFTCGFPMRQPGTTNLIQLRSFPGARPPGSRAAARQHGLPHRPVRTDGGTGGRTDGLADGLDVDDALDHSPPDAADQDRDKEQGGDAENTSAISEKEPAADS